MAKDPAFIFYPGDYLRDTQCLSEKTQVAYDRIMCEHMRNICISQQQLKFFTKRLSEDEQEELLMVLTEVNGGYQISWVAESIEKRRAYSDSRRKNREGSKKDMKKIPKTYVPHMENEIEIENINKDVNDNAKPFIKDSDEFRLSKLLYDLILERNPNNKKPDLQSWAKNIDLMIRVDKRSIKEIEGAIRWSQNDEFWQNNILSTRALRRQFDQLYLKAKSEQNNGTHKSVVTEDGRRRIAEGIANDPRYE